MAALGEPAQPGPAHFYSGGRIMLLTFFAEGRILRWPTIYKK